MDAIDLMKEEHSYIKRMILVLRKMCISIVNNEFHSYEDFDQVIDFVRNFSDKHHHNKEETILFKMMLDNLGEKAVGVPLNGMFVEHDLARLFINKLEEAVNIVKDGDLDRRVDIIANAIAYGDLLTRHIKKEDDAIYNFARNALKSEVLETLNKESGELENIATKNNIQGRYIGILEGLENKWEL